MKILPVAVPDPEDAVLARLLRWWQGLVLPVLGLIVAQFVLVLIDLSGRSREGRASDAVIYPLALVALCSALLLFLLRGRIGGMLPTDANIVVLAAIPPVWLRAGAYAYFVHGKATLLSWLRDGLWLGAFAGVAVLLLGAVALRFAGVLEERGRVIR